MLKAKILQTNDTKDIKEKAEEFIALSRNELWHAIELFTNHCPYWVDT